MQVNTKKVILFLVLFLFYFSNSFAIDTYFIDFTKVLNNSNAGAQAQKNLKSKFLSETKKFKDQEENIRKEESVIVAQKKTLSKDEYKKKLEVLRKKVFTMQKAKQKSFSDIAKSRNIAKQTLLKKINPVVKAYMEENKIRIILDKKSVVMGDSSLEITDKIISILNK